MSGFDPIAYINEPRWQESRLGLERIAELLERMGRPQDKLRFVHVAGTNGKGSVCAYLASVLQEAGYKTGLFTSPYIMQFEERIRVNGKNISLEDLTEVTLFVRKHAEAMAAASGEHPTEFELMTAVAFEHFVRNGCDIAVCEVGLGGRLDSTNVIERPEVCVITRIGLDHTAFLGNTPAEVAREKAGIIKDGVPIVSWPQDDADAMKVVEETAAQHGAPLTVPDFTKLDVLPLRDAARPFTYGGLAFTTCLLGSYQPYNAAMAIEAARVLRRCGWKIADEHIEQGVAEALWPGRFEVVEAGPPALVVDGGHNPQGAAVLADSLRDAFPNKRVVFIMSVLADKDFRPMIRQVASLASAFVCVTPPNPRALPAEELACAVREETRNLPAVKAVSTTGFPEALRLARELAGPSSVICVFGSLYAIADFRDALAEEQADQKGTVPN